MTVWLSFSFFFPFYSSSSTEPSEEPLVDLSDVLNTDPDILGMLGKPSGDSGAWYVSHKQPQWQEFIKGHLAVGLHSRPCGSVISWGTTCSLLSPLNDLFCLFVHIFQQYLILIPWFYLLFALSVPCCAFVSVITVISIILSGFGFL